MNPDLEAAAEAGDIKRLYTLIEKDPYVLENIDKIPFVHTPLHIAASAGKIRFATEIIRLMPSFARKLNTQGLSPMHLALQNGHNKMVCRFVSINKELVRVKGREGLTPLHCVAETQHTDILAEFLSACPDSIEDLTVEGETALHIAVKKQTFEALKVLVGWLQIRSSSHLRESILNWKNESDDTILHVSARLNEAQTVKFLIENGIHLNDKNSEGKTALDLVEMQQVANADIKNMLFRAKALRGTRVTDAPTLAVRLASKITIVGRIRMCISEPPVGDKTRKALMVVAVLIATMTYQSALSPPGGVYPADSGNSTYNTTSSVPAALNSTTLTLIILNNSTQGNQHLQGKSVMSHGYFIIFWFFGTVCFMLSTIMISILLPDGIGSASALAPLTYFTYLFQLAMMIISPVDWLSVIISWIFILFFWIYFWILTLKIKGTRLGRKAGNRKMESMPSGENRW